MSEPRRPTSYALGGVFKTDLSGWYALGISRAGKLESHGLINGRWFKFPTPTRDYFERTVRTLDHPAHPWAAEVLQALSGTHGPVAADSTCAAPMEVRRHRSTLVPLALLMLALFVWGGIHWQPTVPYDLAFDPTPQAD